MTENKNNLSQEFVIDDGCKEYSFKNPLGEVFAKFSFNPTDTGIFERYEEAIKFLETIDLDETEEIEKQITKADISVREQFNIMFNFNISDGIFMRYNPFTLFPDGSFYVEVVIEQIGKIIEKETGSRIEKKIARIRKDKANKR